MNSIPPNQSPPYAARIRALRERSGESPAELAVAVGITVSSYYDLEDQNDEIETCLTLAQAGRLALALGINLRQLLAPNADHVYPTQRITFADLAKQLQNLAAKEGLDEVENKVGWKLDHYLANPSAAWDEPLDFIKFISQVLNVDWMDVIPIRQGEGG